MPEYVYRCRECGNDAMHSQSIYDYLEPVLDIPCCIFVEEREDPVDSRHDLIIQRPGIGYIQGAGGSPNR